MKKLISNLSTSKAALIVGIAFITSIVFVTIVDDFLLANFVIPGDTAALARDIAADHNNFTYAVLGYLLVLLLDSIIGLALFVVLKPTNKNLAALTASLRLLYAGTLIIALIALFFKIIDVHGYASFKAIGYVFFALHILILGYTIFKAKYMPKSLGILLLIASFTYIAFFIDLQLAKVFNVIIMFIMALAELLLSIWLIVKRNTLP